MVEIRPTMTKDQPLFLTKSRIRLFRVLFQSILLVKIHLFSIVIETWMSKYPQRSTQTNFSKHQTPSYFLDNHPFALGPVTITSWYHFWSIESIKIFRRGRGRGRFFEKHLTHPPLPLKKSNPLRIRFWTTFEKLIFFHFVSASPTSTAATPSTSDLAE